MDMVIVVAIVLAELRWCVGAAVLGQLCWRSRRGRRFSTLSGSCCGETVDPMPTLFRFALILCLLGGLGYAAIYALAYLYDPKPREITVSIPPDKFSKQH
jgi:hypothetical protein